MDKYANQRLMKKYNISQHKPSFMIFFSFKMNAPTYMYIQLQITNPFQFTLLMTLPFK